MYCSLKTTLGLATNTAFLAACVADSSTLVKPTIYVNDAAVYFNISGSLTIENVKFSGLNAMAIATDSSQDLRTFPAVFCSVTTQPNGYEAAFKLAIKSSTKSNQFAYSCNDRWYQAPQRLDLSQMSRKCTDNNFQKFDPDIESTLKCAGDLSDQDFFTLNDNKVYAKRRFTLFNIYGFASNSSTYNKPPILYLNKVDFEYFLGGYESLINVESNNLQKVT
jgi:hypothetical protein